MIRAGRALAVLSLLGVTIALATPARADDVVRASPRVLVIAVPGMTWEDVASEELVNIEGLLEESILAGLAVRVDRIQTLPASGYTTVGSGTKAVAPPTVAGLAFGPDEPVGAGSAADAYSRRTGVDLDAGVGHIRIASIEAANDASILGGTQGLLGDALAASGIAAGVVGNADHARDYEDQDDRHREVALGLADALGKVPCGTVDTSLLADDPTAPFGLALDVDAVVEAFEACWSSNGVVLVEASDLRRAIDYRSRVVDGMRSSLWSAALARSDELVGDLLATVDLDRDVVVLVAPSAAPGGPRLTLFGLRAPGVEPGLAESASTRQPGLVSIVDVAPTIAQAAGAELDVGELDGRAVTRAGSGGATLSDRVARLVDADADARFRDRVLTPTVATIIVIEVVVTAVTILLLWRNRRLPRILALISLAILAAFPLTYWAALVPFRELGAGAYLGFLLGCSLVAGALLSLLGTRSLRPLVAAFAAMLATTVLSVTLLGSRLQLSTVFGDSPIVAGRFSGVNNVTFSQVIVATILLGVACVHSFGDRRGIRAMLVLFAATLVVIGAPMWGADVGGVLAGTPALAVTATLLAGWRVRWRDVILYGGLTIVAILLLGLLDLARDSSDRSHLGRLFERVGADGWDGFTTVVNRKLAQNMRTLTTSLWRFILIPVIALAAFVAWRMPGRISVVQDRVQGLRAGLIGIGVAAVLGYALNDSGIAVPGMMLAVLIPAAIFVLVATQEGADTAGAVRRPERDEADRAAVRV